MQTKSAVSVIYVRRTVSRKEPNRDEEVADVFIYGAEMTRHPVSSTDHIDLYGV